MTKKRKAIAIRKKVKEKVLEIFIIVFSILISLWLSNLNEDRKKTNQANEFLNELTHDLNQDITILKANIEILQQLHSNYQFLLNLEPNVPDSIIGPKTVFSFLEYDFNSARYEGFKSSGNLGNIQNGIIKNDILTYYQQMLPNISKSSEYIKEGQLEFVKISDLDAINIHAFFNKNSTRQRLKNIDSSFKSSLSYHQNTVKFIEKLLLEINAEVK